MTIPRDDTNKKCRVDQAWHKDKCHPGPAPHSGSICFPCRKSRFGFEHWRGGRYGRLLISSAFQVSSESEICGVKSRSILMKGSTCISLGITHSATSDPRLTWMPFWQGLIGSWREMVPSEISAGLGLEPLEVVRTESARSPHALQNLLDDRTNAWSWRTRARRCLAPFPIDRLD